MQLRVARLCLDCEELHVDSSCPRCASRRYAFLSAWLPSEERRRRPRPAPQFASNGDSWSSQGSVGLMRSLGRSLSGDKPESIQMGPATRASDFAAQLKFQDAKEEPAKPNG